MIAHRLRSLLKTNSQLVRGLKHKIAAIQPDLHSKYLQSRQDPSHDIEEHLKSRKSAASLSAIHQLLDQMSKGQVEASRRQELQLRLNEELAKLPNDTHPDVQDLGEVPRVVTEYGTKYKEGVDGRPKAKQFAELCKRLNVLRTEHLGHFTGAKSYYLMNDLASLEEALIRFSVKHLRRNGFELISVPDILPAEVIQGCGMQTTGERNQVYKIDVNELCLSGTSEMALAGYFAGKSFAAEQLPMKVMSASRCFRAETSGMAEERGIYRVHNFTKVEMFSVCAPGQSDEVLESFKAIEIDMYQRLGLHFQLLDMPPCELGAPAYRKYDIEAWLPGRQMYGEISSCSNCTDYQSRRLNIRCATPDGEEYAHTVNGTACAVPRMLIAILENFQNHDGSIDIPTELQSYMDGKTRIERTKDLPELKLVKSIKEPAL